MEVKGSVTIPKMKTLAEKSWQILQKFTITKIQWNGIATLGVTLSDGETCKAGTEYGFDKSHNFNPFKKITRIEVLLKFS